MARISISSLRCGRRRWRSRTEEPKGLTFGRALKLPLMVAAIVLSHAAAALAQTSTSNSSVSSPADSAPREMFDVRAVRGLLLDSAAQPTPGALSDFLASGGWRFNAGAENDCVACAANGLQPPRNANAPWTIKRSVTYSGGGGALTLGVIGSRNNRLPLFMTQPLGSSLDLTVPVSSSADVAQTAIRWQLSAAVRKTLKELPAGQTIELLGDVFMPIGSKRAGASAQDAPVLPSKAVRLGLGLGF